MKMDSRDEREPTVADGVAALPLPAEGVAGAAAETAAVEAARAEASGLRRLLRVVVYEHREVIALAILFLLIGHVVDYLVPDRTVMKFMLFSNTVLVILGLNSVIFLIGFAIVKMVRVQQGESLFLSIAHEVRTVYLTPERIAMFAMAWLCVRPVMKVFTCLKQTIPSLQPFAWDETFARWDLVLHGGVHPWEWLHPLLATPTGTQVINFFYHLWLFVMFGVIFWQSWSTDLKLRRQFLISFCLMWMLFGSLAAISLSSAGPCYYGRVTGAEVDPYAPLMAYLHEADAQHHLWALEVQDHLWESYQNRHLEFGRGISAMPSMHVAMAVLAALIGWYSDRRLGVLLIAFAVMIQLGSVHLGWHYAIDGYVSTVLTVALWYAVGWYVRRTTPEETLADLAGDGDAPPAAQPA